MDSAKVPFDLLQAVRNVLERNKHLIKVEQEIDSYFTISSNDFSDFTFKIWNKIPSNIQARVTYPTDYWISRKPSSSNHVRVTTEHLPITGLIKQLEAWFSLINGYLEIRNMSNEEVENQNKIETQKQDNSDVRVLYIFIDIVRYSTERTTEAQADIIMKLNDIVSNILKENKIKVAKTILIQTGDGLCISILDETILPDTQLSIALGILKKIESHNRLTEDKMFQFQVRIGLNENIDKLYLDINSNKNLAGSGINFAQRIMDQGDASQIMVAETIYQKLKPRAMYFKSFRSLKAKDKHNEKFIVYQFIDELEELNTDYPEKFVQHPLNTLIRKILTEDERKNKLEILFAAYGSDKKLEEVTQDLLEKTVNNSLEIEANNEIKCDPDSGNPDKCLYVCYTFEGKIHLKYAQQYQTIKIP
ncbi:MAG TPA: adenylate/guanylate cyclase domain-containing protein [Chitinophagales bacterium]|nr:adenylate/guanylate cyclase domain-containing protein [Chitinophagales bacterium]